MTKEPRNQGCAELHSITIAGWLTAEMVNLNLPLQDYTKAIEIEPGCADAYYRCSKAWLHLGEEEKAKSDMATARNLPSDTITALDKILRDYDRAWRTLGNI